MTRDGHCRWERDSVISREEIRWGFIYLLGREPESEQVYEQHINFPDVSSFRKSLIYSEEASRVLLAQAREALSDIAPELSSPSLVFIHMEKTGGTTLHAALAGAFHPETVTEPHFQYPQRCTINELSRFRLVSGHFSYQDALSLPHLDKTIISLFRNPYERLVSYYRFHRAHPVVLTDNLHVELAHKCTPDEFFRHPVLMESVRLNNIYLRTFLSPREIGNVDFAQADSNVLSTVLRRIDGLHVAGLTEEMASSLKLVGHRFGRDFSADFATLHQTDRLHVLNPDFHRVEPIAMTSELTAALAPYVLYDEAIYRHVCVSFRRQLAAIDIVLPEQVDQISIQPRTFRSKFWVRRH